MGLFFGAEVLSKNTKLAIRVYCHQYLGTDNPIECLKIVGTVIVCGTIGYFLGSWFGEGVTYIILAICWLLSRKPKKLDPGNLDPDDTPTPRPEHPGLFRIQEKPHAEKGVRQPWHCHLEADRRWVQPIEPSAHCYFRPTELKGRMQPQATPAQEPPLRIQ
jgi:hypothetical protein